MSRSVERVNTSKFVDTWEHTRTLMGAMLKLSIAIVLSGLNC